MDGKYSGVQPHRTLENLLLREIILFFLLSSISVYLLFYIHNLVVFFCSKAFRTIADVNLKYIAVFFCLLLLISLSFSFLSILLVVLLLPVSRVHCTPPHRQSRFNMFIYQCFAYNKLNAGCKWGIMRFDDPEPTQLLNGKCTTFTSKNAFENLSKINTEYSGKETNAFSVLMHRGNRHADKCAQTFST